MALSARKTQGQEAIQVRSAAVKLRAVGRKHRIFIESVVFLTYFYTVSRVFTHFYRGNGVLMHFYRVSGVLLQYAFSMAFLCICSIV